MALAPYYNYFLYLLAGGLLVSIFFVIYTKITPYDELKLIRDGSLAASLSLAGALIGFVLSLASSIIHSDNIITMGIWAGLAMGVQLSAYVLLNALIPQLEQQLVNNNVAAGAFFCALSLTLGILNAACLS